METRLHKRKACFYTCLLNLIQSKVFFWNEDLILERTVMDQIAMLICWNSPVTTVIQHGLIHIEDIRDTCIYRFKPIRIHIVTETVAFLRWYAGNPCLSVTIYKHDYCDILYRTVNHVFGICSWLCNGLGLGYDISISVWNGFIAMAIVVHFLVNAVKYIHSEYLIFACV